MQIQPRINQRLLTTLPSFFGGFRAALRELLQNSLRAGASRIEVETTAKIVTIRDNGCGLDDPQRLLSAAESGWGRHVTEPAGIGALSVLNPEWCLRAEFRSRGWRFSLTPEDFMGARTIDVEATEPREGFEATLWLKEERDPASLLRELRIYADPAEVQLLINGQPSSQVQLAGGVEIATAAGTLHLLTQDVYTLHSVIWDRLDVSADALKSLISDPLATPWLTYSWKLVPKEGSGIRPKLPDRTSLIHNAALEEAARDIEVALRKLTLEVAQEVAAGRMWLTQEDLKVPLLEQQDFRAPGLLHRGLKALGYMEVYQPKQDPHLYSDDDGDVVTQRLSSRDYALTLQPAQPTSVHWQVQNAYLRMISARMPLLRRAEKEAPHIPVITNKNKEPVQPKAIWQHWPRVALVDDLQIDGIPVPFALPEGETTDLLLERASAENDTILRFASHALFDTAVYSDKGVEDKLGNIFDLYEPDTFHRASWLQKVLQKMLHNHLHPDKVAEELRQQELRNQKALLQNECTKIEKLAEQLNAQAEAQPLLEVIRRRITESAAELQDADG